MRHSTLLLRTAAFFAWSAIAFTRPEALVSSSNAGEPTGELRSYAKSRTWLDASGKHEINGSLKFADASGVQILQANGKLVRIKLTALSASDRQFVQKFLEAEKSLETGADENPFQISEDATDEEATDRETASQGSGDLSFAAEMDPEVEEAKARANDPPARKTSIQGAKRFSGKFDTPFWDVKPIKGFPDVNFEDFGLMTDVKKPFHSSIRMLTAGAHGVAVVNIYHQSGRDKDNFSRSFVAFAKDGTSTPTYESVSPWKLMSVSPDGRRVAMIRVKGFDNGNEIGIFNVTRQGLVPHFRFFAGDDSTGDISYVGFAAGNRLVTISQRHNVVVWDIGSESIVRAIYMGHSGGASEAEMSPARELMAFPTANGVAIIDIVAAKLTGLIVRANKPNSIAFSPDGKKLAIYEPFSLVVHDMSNGEQMSEISVNESNPRATLTWLDNYLMIGDVVHDIERGLPMWDYSGGNVIKNALSSNVFSVYPSDNGTTIAMTTLPHQRAIDAAAKIDPSTIFAVKKGDNVTVEYNLGTVPANKQEEIRKAVDKKLEGIGWKQVPVANVRVVVEMKAHDQTSEEYYTSHSMMPMLAPFGPRPSGPKETVTYTPWTYKFTIFVGDKKEYEAERFFGSPNNFRVTEGESTQATVTRLTQPGAGFFEQLPIAPNLLKSEYQRGVGKSELTPDGIR